ncbi:CAP domain-containing protein [Catellatospora sp. KI3]|uniref:CAP domain-containing protein n=1 Tax=Catellatospora sp. KI3 TaxID=3041620 RepID=UPI002482C675|nr:CAP domain-containing protein [Catellatospora sp. KI3]MDI1459500.1 CAP domain-containing protein [Catellatospora sp. KI3]
MAIRGRHRTPLQLTPALAARAAILAVAASAALVAAGATTALRHGTVPVDRGASSTAAPSRAADPPAPAALRTAGPRRSPKPRRTEAVTPATDLITWMEDQVTVLVNRERGRAGCDRLRTDERIRTAARRHSADMAGHDFFSHTGRDGSDFTDRLAAAGYPRREAAGENIAYGYPNPQSVVAAWMGSSGHRANILNCAAKAMANGLAYRGRAPYWTQDFGYR